ncbi:ABC transporter ATP-binding protein [Streptomyces sp. adm13(2018)]|uniref:ABC transporter ATP-binding protein n=1 Tax=Streptomyces sp. adm13(2018) TaxID=2479007 RepID=UPI0021C9557F|nr:ABC transporter ATP-binding protein [Streptomyces sp. adm13(2018)]
MSNATPANWADPANPAYSEAPAIEAESLRRGYSGGFEAVRGISLTVRRGEIFALLGTNGAGKTSTVELLEGLAAPSAGTARVLGHDPYRDRAAVRPRIGVMLQEGGFPSELTVAETVRMWAGCTTHARPAAEALGATGLTGREGVRVKQLSGGERRRLDLALALLGRPEILFLDEPTTGLDAEGRRDTWELVRALRDGGTTVLLTTHYLEEAETLADRLAIMHRGQIVLSGTPAQVTGRSSQAAAISSGSMLRGTKSPEPRAETSTREQHTHPRVPGPGSSGCGNGSRRSAGRSTRDPAPTARSS